MTSMEANVSTSVIPLQNVSEEAIKEQLETLLGSTEFARSPRMKSLLRYVVEETIEDRAEYLKGYNIALAVFGRDEAFDPQSDPLVRVQAGRLRRMLTQYYLTEGKNDSIVIMLPKGSYVPCVCKQKLEPTLRESDRLTKPPTGPSIAVLPLNNLSEGSEQQHFADGLSDAIISGLTRFRNLFVLARHTSFQYKNQALDIKELGEKLNVDYLLEGSVRRADNQLRVNAQLIETKDGNCLWSETYHRNLTTENILTIESDISEKVITALAVPYGIIHQSERTSLARRAPPSFNAYEWVQRFYLYWKGAVELFHEVQDGLEQAVKDDPHYSDAWAALAFVSLDEIRIHHNTRPDDKPALERAFNAAKKAVALNENSSMAQQALFCSHFHRNEIDEFLDVSDRALQLNPNDADMLADLGIDYYFIGEHERGLALADKAILLSPVHPGWYHATRTIHYIRSENFKSAYSELKKVDMPNVSWIQILRCAICHNLEKAEDARDAAETALTLNPMLKDSMRKECRIWNMDEDLIDRLHASMQASGVQLQ